MDALSSNDPGVCVRALSRHRHGRSQACQYLNVRPLGCGP
jgi:hypothetical protein